MTPKEIERGARAVQRAIESRVLDQDSLAECVKGLAQHVADLAAHVDKSTTVVDTTPTAAWPNPASPSRD